MRIEGGHSHQPPTAPPPSSLGDQPPTGWRLWLAAIRPRTLTIAVAPVLAGTALAWSGFGRLSPSVLAATLAGAVAIQAGTNLWNDLGDALRGGDQPLRQGPPRVTALGWAAPDRVRRAAMLCFALAGLVGLYLAAIGGWPILALGAASLAAGWAYSGGPRPIAYTALGELFVVAFFGLGAVAGTHWLQAGTLTAEVLVVGLALGLPAAAVLMANNYRDLEADRLVGRRTLAIRLGIDGSRVAYALMMLTPFPLMMAPTAPDGGWVCLGAAPLAIRLIIDFATRPRGPAFNAILAATARFQVMLGVLAALGALL
ncbi:MAG: 1,4-dihydroxy-2-naphthoate octaprenyltransferase [Alphaproteobacteria bacterium]|nr:1,4-dihydroxy-2-naphthoate octaprenyltransferase [Alphaproteobacteria bacterium]